MPSARDIDSAILAALREAPRRTQQQIAKAAKIARGTCVGHLKRLVAQGDVVRGYAAGRRSPTVTGYVLLKAPIDGALTDKVETALRESNVVLTYHLVGSDRYDYVVTVGAEIRTKAVQGLVRKLKSMGVKTETLAVLGETGVGGYDG